MKPLALALLAGLALAACKKEAEKPAPAVTDEPTIKMPPIDGSAIPSDFRLSLDELKFGRNYDGDK